MTTYHKQHTVHACRLGSKPTVCRESGTPNTAWGGSGENGGGGGGTLSFPLIGGSNYKV